MPVRRTPDRGRRWRISPEAAARWREVRPEGLHFGRTVSSADFVDDTLLGDLVGAPALIAMPSGDLRTLRDALDAAL